MPSRKAFRMPWTFLRSALVGLVATGADVATLGLLIDIVGLTEVQANAPALAVGITFQYFGNKYFAFEDKSKDHVRQGFLFLLVEAGTILLNLAGFHLLVTQTPIPYYLVRPLVTFAVYCGFSYPLWKKVFTSGGGDGPASDDS
jgi:putative flippase GtrA